MHRDFEITSCFSGMGTAELCARAFNHELERRQLSCRFVIGGGFELDKTAREATRRVTDGAPCGANLLDLWPDSVRERLAQPFDSFSDLRSFLEAKHHLLASEIRCPDTGARWTISLGHLHCGGNPCKDWSLLGKRTTGWRGGCFPRSVH